MWLEPTSVAFLGLTLVRWLCIAAVLGFGYLVVLNRMDKSCVCDVLPRLRREEVVP